jgi:beta-glucosidase
LSYALFRYRALTARQRGDAIAVSVAVRNDGTMSADEVVQLYVSAPGVVADRPAKLLKGFARVHLAPGQTQLVRFTVPLADLRWRDPSTHQWRFEPGCYTLKVGGSSDTALETRLTL